METCKWQEMGEMSRCGKEEVTHYDHTANQKLCSEHARIAGFGMGHFCVPYYPLFQESEEEGEIGICHMKKLESN